MNRFRSALILSSILALGACASSSPASEPPGSAGPAAELFSPEAGFDDLPEPGRAVMEFASRTIEFDEIAICEVIDDGQGFMFRAYLDDLDGNPASLRVYRRLAGDRVMMPYKEDSVQLSFRREGHIWYHSLLRVIRADAEADIEVLRGRAESFPVRIRSDGLALRATGSLANLRGADGIVPDGEFRVIAHCR